MSKKSRIKKIINKINNFKGFGSPVQSHDCDWFEIEYMNEDDEIIELHWLKVIIPSKEEKRRLRYNMNHSGMNKKGAGETDFLALCFVSVTNPPDGTQNALLYRATKCYQSNTIKQAIAKIICDERANITNEYVRVLIHNYCKVVDKIPGERVTLTNRK